MKDFKITLKVAKQGEESKIIWSSSGGNCHSLTISPDEKYVAYLCEMSGLFVMRIN